MHTKSLKSAINLFHKFAAIPVYPKCKSCGDADPYLDDNGLCYKCFKSEKTDESNAPNTMDFLQKLQQNNIIPFAFTPNFIPLSPPFNIISYNTFKNHIQIAKKNLPALYSLFDNKFPTPLMNFLSNNINRISDLDLMSIVCDASISVFITKKLTTTNIEAFAYDFPNEKDVTLLNHDVPNSITPPDHSLLSSIHAPIELHDVIIKQFSKI